ncbi:Non-hemolytic phospholipase C precursor [Desulfosporosinus acididurans]|uniref:Non-hemolytic phospholipase C n=1 Tax=Desulfosporosinus acididurans TaxID=476652 RepID=A0A0J1FM20_9FIRM|nr:alkaline phosphatase family protein [Desulfosporosinus acididurans]KLU64519.1 Non-hemolytic phospholipase C precursor [Desulfosporosinus acididurans]
MKVIIKRAFTVLASTALIGTLVTAGTVPPALADVTSTPNNTQVISGAKANTPIQHVVVIFNENESFDHYFGTYPVAQNPNGEPPFYATPGTPTVNGLTAALLTNNPNSANPQRLDRSQAWTKDMDHGYTSEQKSFDGGLMDKFVENDGHGDPTVMDYFGGNTVTAFWNYAQHFALNDSYFGSDLGPSTPGALNVVSGETGGATVYSNNQANGGKELQPKDYPKSVTSNGTVIGDSDPYYDYASKGKTISMAGKNVGDLLNAKGLTWGCFFGGYDNPAAQHKNIHGDEVTDYIPHHEPFQYYGATSNTKHQKPSFATTIGQDDQANHQYDMTDFWAAADAGNLPNYSFLKAPAYQDGHPEYSDPLDEQTFLVQTVNKLESLPSWKSTAIFVCYDDSDGWYDHVMPPIVNQSNDPAVDALEGNNAGTKAPLNGEKDRLGYGPRFPMVVISPYAKHNAVINTTVDQSSVLRFVEDNWNLGRIGGGSFDAEAGSLNDMFDFSQGYSNPPVFLNPNSGEPAAQIAPFKQNGLLYMTLGDLEQSLDVQPHQSGNNVWFMYGNHLVNIPSNGDTVTVDTKPVKLGSPIVNGTGFIYLPIDNLAKALNAKIVQYKSDQILFQSSEAPDQLGGLNTNSNTATTAGKVKSSPAAMNITIKSDDNAGTNSLSISTPETITSPEFKTLVNQTIKNAQSGKTYNLIITATDASGNPVKASGTAYVTFAPGVIDKKGTLAASGKNISTTPVAVTLDSSGKAVLTYTVGTAPTDWDAYDYDVITISNSAQTSAASYMNEINILS